MGDIKKPTSVDVNPLTFLIVQLINDKKAINEMAKRIMDDIKKQGLQPAE